MPLAEAVLLSHFMCENIPSNLLAELKPEWNEAIKTDLINKAIVAGIELKPELLFPFQSEIGREVDKEKFSFNQLLQPSLFIRLRPNGFNAGMKKLMAANVDFKLLDNNCVELPNGTKVHELLMLDKEFVVQDFSSQQTGQVVKSIIRKPLFNTFYWDCCAASGGKTIMFSDLYPGLEITVSDIRFSILDNLHKRFESAGIKNYRSFTADLTKPIDINTHKYFDWIVADVPCTGSGTWARTPEELFFFDPKEIETFAVRQKNIVKNALPHLRSRGYFIYITCSVFEKENEGVVKYLQQKGLALIKQQYLKGYENKADTMFIAVFRKAPVSQ
jgi:16S rRNA (cytosine967-C5)-methyltransferase